jgi:hypothetical protein
MMITFAGVDSKNKHQEQKTKRVESPFDLFFTITSLDVVGTKVNISPMYRERLIGNILTLEGHCQVPDRDIQIGRITCYVSRRI